MADKPSQTARWASDQSGGGGTYVTTEPTEDKKDLGWENGEKPRAGYVNWWKNLVGDWTAYVDDIANHAFTWTAAHTFEEEVVMQDGATVTGDVAVSGDVAAGSLTTAQTSVQRAAGWHPVSMSAFNIDAELPNLEYDPVDDKIQASAGCGALTRLACAPLDFLVTGDRIRDIKLTAIPVDGTPSSCDLWLCRKNTATGVVTQLVLATVTTTATRATVVSADIAHVVVDDYTYFLALEMGDDAETGVFEAAGIRVDRIT